MRGIARQLGTTWNTVWSSIRPLPKAMAKEATSDPFRGYKNATDDKLEDATAVLDAFHVVKLGSAAVDEVRRRVQQQIHGHRSRKGDLLYGIRTILRCGVEKITDRQRARLDLAIAADERHDEVLVAWLCAQQLRAATRPAVPPRDARSPRRSSLPSRRAQQWREALLAYFDTGRANNGGTEAINGLIELQRGIARKRAAPQFTNRHRHRPGAHRRPTRCTKWPSHRTSSARRWTSSISSVAELRMSSSAPISAKAFTTVRTASGVSLSVSTTRSVNSVSA